MDKLKVLGKLGFWFCLFDLFYLGFLVVLIFVYFCEVFWKSILKCYVEIFYSWFFVRRLGVYEEGWNLSWESWI